MLALRTWRTRRIVVVAAVLAAGAFPSAGAAVAGGAPAPASAAPAVDRAAFAGHGDLAFVSRGRLWVLDGARGTLQAASPAGTVVSEPRFSPDRRLLSFDAGGRTWLARADGGRARAIGATGPDGGDWLPDGRLIAAGALWRIARMGAATRAGALPAGLAGWSSDGSRYVFFSTSLRVRQGHASRGVERLEVSSSITGPRRTWFASRVSFSPRAGLSGGFLHDVVVLPGRAGILFRVDPDGSSSLLADGVGLFELSRPGARPIKLGVLVGLPVAVGAGGAFAITDGPDRYAWLTKRVLRCEAARRACAPVPAAPGALTLDPALAPGGMLAFVEAPSSSSGDFGQAAVRRWYADHSLWTLTATATHPTRVPGAGGASAPRWSADGRSLVYAAGNALWLLRSMSATPTRIAGPLFAPGRWPSYYGQVDWAGQFAWSG